MSTTAQECLSSVEIFEADSRSSHAWSCESVPAPTRFVRKQAKGKVDPVIQARCEKDMFLFQQPNIVELDESVCSFMSATNSRSNDLKYYSAHRQFVAQEIADEVSTTSEIEDWEPLLATTLF